MDAHESPAAGAIREAWEEASVKCRKLEPLLYLHPGLDTLDNPTFLFRCSEFDDSAAGPLHQGEVTERAWLPLEESIRMIFRKEIVDSLTVAALLAYRTLIGCPALERPLIRSRRPR